MIDNPELFQAIQSLIPKVFADNGNVLTMRQARPLIANALRAQGFDYKQAWSEVYRHLHASSLNIFQKKPSRAYRDARRMLWNDVKSRTFRLLTPDELRLIAAGKFSGLDQGPHILDMAAVKNALKFAKEQQLRDYLAGNLEVLEQGLTLWEREPPSVEFAIAFSRIDILAKDVSGRSVIIELKLRHAHDRVAGQALLYRALLRKHLKLDKTRIFLIAEKIAPELALLKSEIKDIVLFEYSHIGLPGDSNFQIWFKRKE